nr:GNAT family N-acetyltransferase [Bacillus sp. FJAT-45037]
MDVMKVTNQSQLDDAYSVRMNVFVDEQNVPKEEELDQYDETATHFVVYNGNEVVGAARLRQVETYAKMERVCIAKEVRGTGVGKILMKQMEAEAKDQKLSTSKLNAQTQAVPFYEKLGYTVISEEFLDAGIPHVTMTKAL